ncbi:MAG: hypothetical protein GX221_10510 [Candidatus Riflebacteria bacterium]|nr:hypothetical protein [Candidatus Riflebacteria bacterium]
MSEGSGFKIKSLEQGKGFSCELENSSFVLPQSLLELNEYKYLERRDFFRDLLKKNAFTQPEYIVAEKFSDISAFAISRCAPPLCIKFANNGVDSENIYLLKAYRELPLFWEKLTAGQDTNIQVIAEKYIEAEYYLEVTLMGGKVVCLSQIGFEKNFSLAAAWRYFPVSLSPVLSNKIKGVAKLFPNLLKNKEVPFRLSFAAGKKLFVPLSFNVGFNRLEYSECLSDFFGGFSFLKGDLLKSGQKYKLLLFNKPKLWKKKREILEAEAEKQGSVFITQGNKAACLFSGKTASLLQEKTAIISNLLKM